LPSASAPSFLPVQVIASANGRSTLAEAAQIVEILLAHGRTLRVRAGFDRQTLADVLTLLEARPC
jgi:hypothetical protein